MKNHLKFILLEERIVLDAAIASVIYVNINTHADAAQQTGADWAHAWSNLQSALTEAAAHPGDQIWVASGTYLPSTTGDKTATFNIPDQTSIYGGFKGTESNLYQRNPDKNPTILSGNLLGNNTDKSYTIVTIGATPSETVTLDGLTITDANNTLSGLGGGLKASNGSNVTLSHIIFSHDSANLSGGAIFANGVHLINILDSQFLDNSAFNISGATARGGAIRIQNSDTVSIIGSIFEGNSASLGGAFYDDSVTNTTIQSSNFEYNTAIINGGALRFSVDTNVTVTQSVFDHNSVPGSRLAVGGGGAISAIRDQNDTFTYNTFTYNSDTTPRGFGGGAIYSNGSILSTISHNIFDNNNSVDPVNHGNIGAAINIDTGNTINITYNSFTNNTSDAGGAIGAIPFVSNLNIGYNSFVNNSAVALIGGAGGGAVFTLLDNTVNIHDNLFLKNTAAIAGGALDLGFVTDGAGSGLADTNVTVTNNIFINNSADQQGGAIASAEKNLIISNNVFAHNSAVEGGAIVDSTSTSLLITNNVFAANSATHGASLWLDGLETSLNGASPATNPQQVITNLLNANIALFDDAIYLA